MLIKQGSKVEKRGIKRQRGGLDEKLLSHLVVCHY